jgi:hypothetical protein
VLQDKLEADRIRQQDPNAAELYDLARDAKWGRKPT